MDYGVLYITWVRSAHQKLLHSAEPSYYCLVHTSYLQHVYLITACMQVHSHTNLHTNLHTHMQMHTYIPQVYRKNWMFRLVGVETFKIGKKTAEITITSKGMAFEYALSIGGKTLKKFIEAQAKNTRTWLPVINTENHRVVLGEWTAHRSIEALIPYQHYLAFLMTNNLYNSACSEMSVT